MFNLDTTNPAILFAGVSVVISLLSLSVPSSTRSILLLVTGFLLYRWYQKNQLPPVKIVESITDPSMKKHQNMKFLEKDYSFRKIVTQHKRLRRYNIPVFDTIVYQINQFIKCKYEPTTNYQYDKALTVKDLILNNTSSLLLSIPSNKPSLETKLTSFQQDLETLLNYDLEKLRKTIDKQKIQLSRPNDIQCVNYSPHFNLY
jgi:hypothetical protein